MGLKQKLKNIALGTLAATALLGSAQTAQAQEPKTHKAEIEFVNPMDDFDSNTKLWHSLNELGDYGLRHLDLDDTVLGRATKTVAATWINWATSYFSHEAAHGYAYRRTGTNPTIAPDFSDWSKLVPTWGYKEPVKPQVINREWPLELKDLLREKHGIYLLNVNDYIHQSIDGLVQNELNASYAYKENIRDQDVYSSITYLGQKLGNMLYAWLPLPMEQEGDVEAYYSELAYHKNMNVKHFKWATLLTTLGSGAVWESLMNITGYISNGELSQPKQAIGNSYFFLPNLRTIPTVDGNYVEIEQPLRNGKNYVLLTAGTGMDTFGADGTVDTFRVSATYDALDLASGDLSLRLTPTVALNFGNGFIKGYHFGAGMTLNYDNFGITAQLEIGNNDMLENRIKTEPNGIRFRLGIKADY